MNKVLRIAYWQPSMASKVETTDVGSLLYKDYSALAVGQVVAEDEDVVVLALVGTASNCHSLVIIPQRCIIDAEELDV
jgi:hypothetical protein